MHLVRCRLRSLGLKRDVRLPFWKGALPWRIAFSCGTEALDRYYHQ